MVQHKKLTENYTNVAGRADEEVRKLVLDANLPCIVDLRLVHGYRCNEIRIPAPKQSLWAWLWGEPTPIDKVLYEHHIGEKGAEESNHDVVINNTNESRVGVGWTIRLAGSDGRDVIAKARVSHRTEYGWTTICPGILTRNIGRLSEALVSTHQLLPKEWFPEPVDHGSGMYPAPDVFVSEAQEVLRAKLVELVIASAPVGWR